MTYRIERDERLPDAARRVAREEIDGALQDLLLDDPDAAVHAIRKHFKRLRALVRLLRADMGPDEARARNRAMGEAAGTLSEARDSRILIDGARTLAEGCEGERRAALDRLVTRLEARHARNRERLFGEADRLGSVGEVLTLFREDVASWRLSDGGFEVLAPGLRRTYRRGGKHFAAALATPTSHALHQWRKRVKDLWYHVTLLEEVWPETMLALVASLEGLSDRLGIDHDFAVLDDVLRAEPELCPDPADLALVRAAIDNERGLLQAESWPLGRRIWAEDPRAFVHRVEGYWTAWRA